MKSRVVQVAVVSVFATALFTSCGGESAETTGATELTANVHEWHVAVSKASAPAGEIVFTVTNSGTMGHEFLVVKTDLAPGEIPLAGDHFNEPTDGIEVIDEIGEFAAGLTNILTLNLEPGNYQLVCNLPDHYKLGMSSAFEVTS